MKISCPHCYQKYNSRKHIKMCSFCKQPLTKTCPHCNSEWRMRTPNPTQCPDCHHSMQKQLKRKYKHHCQFCNHLWIGQKPNPKQCPDCHQPPTKKRIQRQYTCTSCSYKFRSKEATECPLCFNEVK